ncbi:KpsF/GutQ family sugar-phosphate isomerase [Pseudoalteromonas citrea]|uniref:Arabinose 5-phosphate isomerase n=1 Tax=Pseudoalteromonas citrea TaxID=43655 RepID=A0A5S3XF94_9GAMM|nr:KpsF/GutQ family sugar-phosphate isomerase [Pseudoalteromonas citrea]TMP41441.1 KpsF/GutQ family sugar-phosphate isomerase [Pseudoalteromonas citrea]TMP51133.1 KpsF/GutQ family sugar-phosphate isomerase [Pseudoalteromonas citrea]
MASSIDIAREVIQTEIEGLDYMAKRLGSEFEVAINAIINTKGRTIICGMGKSGIIGKKIAASFASTGTPSFFMHPGEAFHGDLGMVKPEDVFIAISNSGETDEVLKLLPFLHDNDNFVIAITGKESSTLASNSHCHLDVEVPKEACFLQLAPTSSTTATLVMGDALTVALMDVRGFKSENFARFHPGGSLGRRLLLKVRDEMFSDNLPCVSSDADFTSIINTISSSHLGLTLVNLNNVALAIITDGDLRRAMESKGRDAFDLIAKDIASINPIAISPELNMQEAYEVMESKGITSLLVKENNKVVGVLKK